MSNIPSSSGTVPSADQAAASQHPVMSANAPPPPSPGQPPLGTQQFTYQVASSSAQLPPVVSHPSLMDSRSVVSQLHARFSMSSPVYSRPRPATTTAGQFSYGMPHIPDLPTSPATPQSHAPASLLLATPATPPADLATLVTGLVELTHAQITLQRQQYEFLMAQQQHHGRPDPGVKQFKEMNPPIFFGEETPLESEEWLRCTKDCLESARIARHEWVSVARLQLKENARNWWDAELTRHTSPISWEQFTTAFNAKYFPHAARIQLQEEFLNLEQGEMTVDQYDAKYSKLGRFAEHVIADPRHRAGRFLRGLDLDIQDGMALTYATQAEVLAAARGREALLKRKAAKLARDSQATATPSFHSYLAPTPAVSFKLSDRGQSSRPTRKHRHLSCSKCHQKGHPARLCPRRQVSEDRPFNDPNHEMADCEKSMSDLSLFPSQQQAYQHRRQDSV